MSYAVLQSALAMVKPPADAAISQRVDVTRLNHPDNGMTMISAIR